MEPIVKMRIAMVCHFSNSQIRSRLPLKRHRYFYSFVRRLLGMPSKGNVYGDIAPWDTSTIHAISQHKEIELYVISAHSGMKKNLVSFEENDVRYTFINCVMANFLKKVIPDDELWRKMNPMVKAVHRRIDDIKPDLILLVGTENAYYSGTILGIKNVPVYVLCQTIYNNPERKGYGTWLSKNATTEMEIFKQHRYFGVYCKMHYNLLKRFNPDAQIFKFGFPSEGIVLEPTVVPKVYDFVNFAFAMDVRKGFHDSLRALAILKQKYPSVTMNLVGSCSSEQRSSLDALIEELSLEDNIIFTPFFEKRSDLLDHIQKSRFAVLPCKMDNISGTMLQSMSLGIPLVVYKTEGTPSLNSDEECVLIAEKNDVCDLASKMQYLMDHPDKAQELAVNARSRMIQVAEKSRGNADRLIDNFQRVIDSFRSGSPVPSRYLFNPEIDE